MHRDSGSHGLPARVADTAGYLVERLARNFARTVAGALLFLTPLVFAGLATEVLEVRYFHRFALTYGYVAFVGYFAEFFLLLAVTDRFDAIPSMVS